MAHRAFGQKKSDDGAVAPEPITFDIGDEKGIQCRKAVNGKLLIELVGKVDSGSVSQQSEGILKVFDVVVRTDDGENPDAWTGRSLASHSEAELANIDADNIEAAETWDKEEHDEDDEFMPVTPGVDPTSSLGRLQKVLDDPDTEIQIEELAELVGWLVEQYTARPTGNAPNSRSGRTNTRPTSRRARRKPGGTGAELTPVSSST